MNMMIYVHYIMLCPIAHMAILGDIKIDFLNSVKCITDRATYTGTNIFDMMN